MYDDYKLNTSITVLRKKKQEEVIKLFVRVSFNIKKN